MSITIPRTTRTELNPDLETLLRRLNWHNDAVPFVLRFAHSLTLNMWERSFLFSVACDYSLDPDHGWIHGTDVVAQTKLAPRSVPEIAKRFPELVERRRHHGNYFGYRFMLPASAPPIRSIAPRWTHDQEEAKYQLVTMNEISTADLKVSQSLLFRMLLYLCFRAEVDLTDTEIPLSTHHFRVVVAESEGTRHRMATAAAANVDSSLRTLGLRVLKTPTGARANAFCERLIGSAPRERLDFIIPSRRSSCAKDP
jgi:hypothetical protein